MALQQEVEQGIKQAMLAKDKDRLRTLRAVKSAILLVNSESGASKELSSDDEMKILTKAAKQRRDSIDVFEKQGRDDLASKEKIELNILEEFLPKQMDESEVEAVLEDLIKEIGASSPADMGKVMGAATKKMAGKADGKLISTLVRKLLS